MNVTILYHPNSEHERAVLNFEREFKRRTDKVVDLVSVETRDGADMARLYDIMTYPTVIARRDDGAVLKVWQEEKLPLINEVAYYAQDSLGENPATV